MDVYMSEGGWDESWVDLDDIVPYFATPSDLRF
jgi:hypothetical protein